MDKQFNKPQNYWSPTIDQLLLELATSKDGLSSAQAQERLKLQGLNQIVKEKTLPPALRILLSQFKNWLVVVLLLAAVISSFLGEHFDALIVISIVILSVLFGFFQEYKAEKTLEKLKKFVSHKVRVKRDKEWIEIDSKNLVAGDIVKLQIGDLVPADIRLISIDDLSANESALTGESVPVSKQTTEIAGQSDQLPRLANTVFMGTSIAGGYGEGVVVATGMMTFFGKTAAYLEKGAPETDFQKGTRQFSVFLFRVIFIMTVFVFIANSWLGKGVFDSFLFAVALAVGITPELLPAIMTVTLSQGALKMAQKKVVVKRLMSIEDLGNIDTLCTDKTGTLTRGVFSLSGYVDGDGVKDPKVLLKSLVCTSNFVHGKGFSTTNPIDQALWQSLDLTDLKKDLERFTIIDENEFDFERRRTSVLVKSKDKFTLVVKGSPESILAVTNTTSEKRKFLLRRVKNYEEDGFRVIAVAESKIHKSKSSKEDEKNLSFLGFLLFSDPVKPDAKASLDLFRKLGVEIKVLSGDSVVVTKSVVKQVGLEITEDKIISGETLERLSDNQLETYARKYHFFARVTPEQKYKIVASLNKKGHIVGFLGDGINDAPALKAADVGIAVDTGASVAKEAADIILLRKDLRVLAEGVEMGRKTFGNTMKYILNTISANYGNMFTVAISSLFLKFIPLLPKQILLNNFVSDIPLFTIATDNVDREFTRKPKRWNIKLIDKFMLYFGLISTIFDLTLILPMVFIWKLPTDTFRTAWFIESSLSEILVTFAIRTRLPFYKSMPSKLLVFSSILAGSAVVFMPLLGFGQKLFEFSNLPIYLWSWIGIVLLGYFLITEAVKHLFFNKYEL